MAATLVERLKPDHLDLDDVKQQIEQKTKDPEPKPTDDPRAQERFTFQFRWTDPRGKVWDGAFTNKILSIRERQLAGSFRSVLAAGIAASVLDDYTNELNLIISHLKYSLVDHPEWAKNLQDLQDPRIAQALYEEVLAHEATFLGPRPVTTGGKA